MPSFPAFPTLHAFASRCGQLGTIAAVTCCLLASLAGSATAQSERTFESTWYMVVDWANLLDEGQETSAINDTWRLNQLGIPAQVVTELAQSTPELARQRAEALRIDHAIESRPGANDGILVYAAVNPADRSLVTMSVAVGPNALPYGGLTDDDITTIQSDIMVPQLIAGHPARAIVYSVREMIYQEIFTPPPGDALAGWRASLNNILPWLAPLIAIAATLLAWRGSDRVRGIGGMLVRLVPPVLMGVALAAAGVTARSAPATFWAIGLLLVAVGVAIRADRRITNGNRRRMLVTPRPPGRFESHTKASS